MSRLLFAAGASALLLGGCSILPESEPVDIYRLTGASAGEITPREFGAPTVMISLPSANRALGGTDIMVLRDDASLAIAAGARWAAPGRNLVQDYIVEAFETGAAGIAPLRPGDGISGDYDLSIDLRNFEAVYDRGEGAAPAVRVTLGARLISAARDLEGSTVLSSEARAAGNTMRDIVAAFDTATGEVAAGLAGWTVERVRIAELRIAREALEGAGDTDVSIDAGPGADVDIDVDIEN